MSTHMTLTDPAAMAGAVSDLRRIAADIRAEAGQ